METLYECLKQLYNYLLSQGILKEELNLPDNYYELLDLLLLNLKITYPQTKFKKIMKSVHCANGFNDEKLKEAVYKLDEINQLLAFNKYLVHDAAVNFFNNQIAKREVNQYTLIQTMIECLMYPAMS